MSELHPLANHHLPAFITAPGETDVLLVVMAFVLVGAVLAAGVFFFWLHSLPERMVHNKIQFDIVAVLALLSLFTHQHAFWVAALIVALISFPNFAFPDFSGLLARMANSLDRMAASQGERADAAPEPETSADVPAKKTVAAPANSVPAKGAEVLYPPAKSVAAKPVPRGKEKTSEDTLPSHKPRKHGG